MLVSGRGKLTTNSSEYHSIHSIHCFSIGSWNKIQTSSPPSPNGETNHSPLEETKLKKNHQQNQGEELLLVPCSWGELSMLFFAAMVLVKSFAAPSCTTTWGLVANLLCSTVRKFSLGSMAWIKTWKPKQEKTWYRERFSGKSAGTRLPA